MKRIIVCIMVAALLLTGCNFQKESGQVPVTSDMPQITASAESEKPTETDKEEKGKQDFGSSETETVGSGTVTEENEAEAVDIGEIIEPLVSEKIDVSKQGVAMSFYMELPSTLVKGDDGSCYYFRNKGKGENKKIVFYKNNGIKVCETTMKKSLEQKKYYIQSFVKYGDYFFVVLQSYQIRGYVLTTIHVKTGKWGKLIKPENDFGNAIVYDNCFYCLGSESKIIVYNILGKEKKIGDVSPKKPAHVQCIVDDWIYYLVCEGEDWDVTRIMRCRLNGKKKETLLECKADSRWSCPEDLKIDKNYLYLNVKYGDFTLTRIPLYGGEIQGIAKGVLLELSENSIFFQGTGKYIYKIGKDLVGKPKKVAKSNDWPGIVEVDGSALENCPYLYADGHLVVQGKNKKELKIVNKILGDEYGSWALWADVTANYAPDWYWVSEDGKVEDVIKGSGVKKRWK